MYPGKVTLSVSWNRLNLKHIHVMIKAEKILCMRSITCGHWLDVKDGYRENFVCIELSDVKTEQI